jgi:hypothetical protein
MEHVKLLGEHLKLDHVEPRNINDDERTYDQIWDGSWWSDTKKALDKAIPNSTMLVVIGYSDGAQHSGKSLSYLRCSTSKPC